jgi:hypothetical protein
MKSRKSSIIIANLEETFNILRWFNNKLNPEKCTFEVPQGKLLGYIKTDKISAIVEIGQVGNVKDVQ